MAECKQYLTVLIESSDRKIVILEQLLLKNEEQANAIQEKKIEIFDAKTEEKSVLIEELLSLDNGFTSIYDKISVELKADKSSYIEEIKTLQAQIAEITEKSMAVQTSEHRNKQLVEQYFSKERKEIRKSKAGLKTASDYYKSMSRVDYTTPQMLDQKK